MDAGAGFSLALECGAAQFLSNDRSIRMLWNVFPGS